MNKLIFSFLVIFGPLAVHSDAHAASSQWQELGGGKARLVAVKDAETGSVEGIVEFRLEEGWKTYWRSPGDSGIPPVFDFAGSRDLEVSSTGYPVPSYIEVPGSSFMGYREAVSFPFSGETFSDDANVVLDMQAGICEEICIPAFARFEIPARDLNSSDPRGQSLIALAKSTLPGVPDQEFGVVGLTTTDESTILTASYPANAKDVYLLVEGPEGWFSGALRPDKENSHEFAVKMPKGFTIESAQTQDYRYTLIADGQAVEAMLAAIPLQ